MIPETATIGELVQHALVTLVALGAAGVVLRRVLGVFERPASQSSSPGAPHATGPACSHCAAGNAAQKRRTG